LPSLLKLKGPHPVRTEILGLDAVKLIHA